MCLYRKENGFKSAHNLDVLLQVIKADNDKKTGFQGHFFLSKLLNKTNCFLKRFFYIVLRHDEPT